MKLTSFKHDRSIPIDEAVIKLYEYIESFANKSELDQWYSWLERRYCLPKDVSKMYLKQRFFRNDPTKKDIY